MALSPQSRYLAVPNLSGGAEVIEVATGRQVSVLPDSLKVFKLNFSPDNRYVLVCGEEIARIFEVSSGREVWAIGDGATVAPVISPDGNLVALGSDNMVWLFDLNRRKPKWKLHGFVQANAIAFTPDGRYLAVADRKAKGRVFEASDGKEISAFPIRTMIGNIVFAPSAPYFVANTGLYETTGWSQIAPFQRPDMVDAVAFSPDNQYVAAGSLDHTVRVFGVAARAEVARITNLEQILTVGFDRTGGRLVTVSGRDDNYMLLSTHFVRTAEVVDDTCARLTRNLTRSEWTQYIGNEPYRATCPNIAGDRCSHSLQCRTNVVF
jgi:WD40 repeat protein